MESHWIPWATPASSFYFKVPNDICEDPLPCKVTHSHIWGGWELGPRQIRTLGEGHYSAYHTTSRSLPRFVNSPSCSTWPFPRRVKFFERWKISVMVWRMNTSKGQGTFILISISTHYHFLKNDQRNAPVILREALSACKCDDGNSAKYVTLFESR